MSSSSSSSSSNIVVRLPLVFSTTNDDVVASCSVRENKRERDISKTCSRLSLDGPHKREKSDEKGRCGSLSCRLQKSVLCVRVHLKKFQVETQFFPKTVVRFHAFRV